MKIALSVGELSGDEHASAVVEALRRRLPVEMRGMGGRMLRAAGVDTVVDSEQAASVMGFVEVLSSLGRIRGAFREMKRLLTTWKPDVLLLIDYPDFNLRLARFAHSQGIPVVYYIAPKAWIWRRGRVREFARYVDRAAFIFPHEEEFFGSHGFSRGSYVGNPIVDHIKRAIPESFNRGQYLESLGLSATAPVIALFPGSRRSEIKRHMAPVLEGLKRLRDEHPDVQAIVAAAPSLNPCELGIHQGAQIVVAASDSLKVLKAADAALLKSGTSNLQAALLGVPCAMFYVASPLSAWIVRTFLSIRAFSPVNIIRAATISEILQEQVTPARLAQEMKRCLFDQQYRLRIRDGLAAVASQLSLPTDSNVGEELSTAERVAQMVIETGRRSPV